MMNIQRDPLDIIFRQASPERFLDMLLRDAFPSIHSMDPLSVRWLDQKNFRAFADSTFPDSSPDELDNIHDFIFDQMSFGKQPNSHRSVFSLLTDFAGKVLDENSPEPICRQNRLLRWREVSHRMGQDLFTTSFFAQKDLKNRFHRTCFSWPLEIRTDDRFLQEFYKEGLSENHFHLYGGAPVFQISWLILMNHPEDCRQFYTDKTIAANFEWNLMASPSLNQKDHLSSWTDRTLLAAWLRAKLFQRLSSAEHITPDELRGFTNSRGLIQSKTAALASVCRFSGKTFEMINNRRYCLDYAYPASLNDPLNDGYHRLYVGERYFLYQCFKHSFDGSFTLFEQDLFYLYLLLKSRFRSELIQSNGRHGFKNFKEYQDRKYILWGNRQEYWWEANRTAINGSVEESNLKSFELRIGPDNTASGYIQTVRETDRQVRFDCDNRAGNRIDPRWYLKPPVSAESEKHFYVMHFPKSKIQRASNPAYIDREHVRNYKVRYHSKIQAFALAKALGKDLEFRRRLCGIDACSSEIGCRPETFATEFRFLRSLQVPELPVYYQSFKEFSPPHLKVTYHAGEDFLDIIDGLRAIDEAIQFLQLQRNDRIGHALALGIDPEQFFRLKKKQIILPKQDRLDNLVWLLYRSNEFGLFLPSCSSKAGALVSGLRHEANHLFDDIYGNIYSKRFKNEYRPTLDDYYESWKLRGNHPSLYEFDPFDDQSQIRRHTLPTMHDQYIRAMTRPKLHIANPDVCRRLYHLYHYSSAVRREGMKQVSRHIDAEYSAFCRMMQDAMIDYMIQKGIAVECCPSSNLLISTFERYDQHPIFRFNAVGLSAESRPNDLCVSVNTDDQGVFDTSLANEYALLDAALTKMTDSSGAPLYTTGQIQNYLRHLKEMSDLQTFPH